MTSVQNQVNGFARHCMTFRVSIRNELRFLDAVSIRSSRKAKVTEVTAQIQLKRGWTVVNRTPSIDDVFSLMSSVEGLVGPPSIVLECVTNSDSEEQIQSSLVLTLAFCSTKPPSWFVDFGPPKARELMVLTNYSSTDNEFETCTCCGLISKYR